MTFFTIFTVWIGLAMPMAQEKAPDSAPQEVQEAIRKPNGLLTADDPKAYTYFGMRLGGSDDKLFIGRSGAIEVYELSGNTLSRVTTLLPGENVNNPGTFGSNFQTDGTTVAEITLGVKFADKISVFRRGKEGWITCPAITSADVPGEQIGLKRKVSLNGDELAVLSSRGVELFSFENGRFVWKSTVQRPEAIGTKQFGSSLALGENMLAVGCWRYNNGQEHIEVFVRSDDAWKHQGSIQDPEGRPGERFGALMAIDGKDIVVGVSQWETGTGCVVSFELESNKASVFKSNEDGADKWVVKQRIKELEKNECCFGSGFVLNGDQMMISAASKQTSGSFYLYQRDQKSGKWKMQEAISCPAGMEKSRFGSSVALVGDIMAVSAPQAKIKDQISAGCVAFFAPTVEDKEETGKTALNR